MKNCCVPERIDWLDFQDRSIPIHWKYDHAYRYKLAKKYCKGKVVTDIGCGYGCGSYLLSDIAKRIISIDSSHNFKDKYKTQNIIFLRSDAEKIALKNESVDTVVCLEMIEHLKNPEDLVRGASRILKPEGILFLSTPNKKFTQNTEDAPYHIGELHLNELIGLLKNNGDFELVKIIGQGINLLPLWPFGPTKSCQDFAYKITSQKTGAKNIYRTFFKIALLRSYLGYFFPKHSSGIIVIAKKKKAMAFDKAKIINYYETLYKEGKVWADEEYYNWITGILGNIEGYKILDVGCGNGEMLKAIKQNGGEPYGIDITLTALKIAKNKVPNSMLAFASAEEVPYKNNFFDHIIYSGVFEHVFCEDRSLMEVKRMLKENGKFIVVVPNRYWLGKPLEKVAQPIAWFFRKITGKKHFGRQLIEREYTRKSFEKLIEKKGFKITEWHPYQIDVGIVKNGKFIVRILNKNLIPARFCNHHVFVCQKISGSDINESFI